MSEHCQEHKCKYSCCSVTALLITLIVVLNSFDTVEPTEFGLAKNTFTGEVDLETVYDGGRYMTGVTKRFLKFPATYVTLSFGPNGPGRGKKATGDTLDEWSSIGARSGSDGDGSSGGGQPVEISLAFTYHFRREWVPQVFEKFGQRWESSFLRFAQQEITNVAQQYTPRQFWEERRTIERAMHDAVNASLVKQGHVTVPTLQLRHTGFLSSYEQTITNIQLQEQLKVTKSYQLDVTRVLKQVDLLQSTTDAEIAVINAEADRQKQVIEGAAEAEALKIEQNVKANMYAKLTQHLSWGTPEFLRYIKMKALNEQETQKKVVVGVDPIGTVASA